MNAKVARLLQRFRKTGLSHVRRPLAVRVIWVDAETYHGWRGTDNPPTSTLECSSVGYIVAAGRVSLTLAATIAHHVRPASMNQVLRIPLQWIKDVIVLDRTEFPEHNDNVE